MMMMMMMIMLLGRRRHIMPSCAVWFTFAMCLYAIPHGHGQATTTSVTVNITNSTNVTTQPPPTCPPDYTKCRCVFLREPAKYYYDTGFLPHQISIWRDLVCALYGFPFGVALSIATFFLYHWCKSGSSRDRKPVAKWNWRTNIKGRISPFQGPDSKLKSK